MGDYVAINKAMWDERAPVHAASAHYGFDQFFDDPEKGIAINPEP